MTKLPRLALFAAAVAFPIVPAGAQGTPDPDLDRAHHVLRRITFGPNRALVQQLKTGLAAAQSYITAQLNPPAVGAPNYHGSAALDQLLTGSYSPGTTGTLLLPNTLGAAFNANQTSQAQLAYALESEWQLREVMTQFWERHFNTHLFSQGGYFVPYIPAGADYQNWVWWFEWEANEYYRANCLTTFADLLSFTSHHASMMIYLHMPQNDGGPSSHPNEDYARELLELYTMSPQEVLPSGTPQANYDQTDVEAVARILTGWDLDEPNAFVFQFDDADHTYPTGPTTLFQSSTSTVTIAAQTSPNGEQEGNDLLLALAGHPATKDFVCRKLIREFIGEVVAARPNPAVLQAMKAAWGTQGQIQPVLTALFSSNDFLGTSNHLNHVRLPMESVVATARAIEAQVKTVGGLADPGSMMQMINAMLAQGMALFGYPAPNGFPTYNNAQLSPSLGLERTYCGWNVLLNAAPAQAPATDVIAYVQPVQPPLPASPTVNNVAPHYIAVADYLLTEFYGSNFTLEDELRVLDAIAAAANWVTAQTNPPYAGNFDPAQPEHYKATILVAATAALGMVQSAQR
ncbi:MAG: DUF1800 family protein [Planctomycetes bacterium]|nr:DUF1800 family protein [Planctomycetota bacterium]